MTVQELADLLRDVQEAAKRVYNRVPDQTCPAINKAIACINSSQKLAKSIHKADDIDDAYSIAEDIEYELYGVADELEELREHNHTLRKVAEDLFEIIMELEEA